ncbi:LysE/ArgO family amino acid transporter [Helicobacter cetorum]|uniref:LysE/ArgO family amino acid transporter n=1 Tax=Helicobacter cetorum TaxID=138563 RepID=UPI000CF1ADFC|nr:LysE family transporter [Helicobacter cetorum]
MFTFLKGFGLALSLNVAIGAQTLFIIQQGIARNHVFLICVICFVCDIFLMSAGVFGVGAYLSQKPYIALALSLCGALFTGYYAFMGFLGLLKTSQTKKSQTLEILSLKKTLLFTLAVSLLNPQIYLEMLFLIGASAISLDNVRKLIFLFGALFASLLWLGTLGSLSARYGSIFLSNKKATIGINLLILVVMGSICLTLIKDFLALLETL